MQDGTFRKIGACSISEDALIDPTAVIGYPTKATIAENNVLTESSGATIGPRCIVRSGTVVYEGAKLAKDVNIGHNAVIREHAKIGAGSAIGNGCVVLNGAELGRNVRMMEHGVVCEYSHIEQDVFIGPGVCMAAGRQMLGALIAAGRVSEEEAQRLEGDYWGRKPTIIIESGARIGANAVILAGITIGSEAVVAAGALVSVDVPPRKTVVGNPARLMS
jgi:acetyltransferase-like isoleucine patch superfamily enzyme